MAAAAWIMPAACHKIGSTTTATCSTDGTVFPVDIIVLDNDAGIAASTVVPDTSPCAGVPLPSVPLGPCASWPGVAAAATACRYTRIALNNGGGTTIDTSTYDNAYCATGAEVPVSPSSSDLWGVGVAVLVVTIIAAAFILMRLSQEGALALALAAESPQPQEPCDHEMGGRAPSASGRGGAGDHYKDPATIYWGSERHTGGHVGGHTQNTAAAAPSIAAFTSVGVPQLPGTGGRRHGSMSAAAATSVSAAGSVPFRAATPGALGERNHYGPTSTSPSHVYSATHATEDHEHVSPGPAVTPPRGGSAGYPQHTLHALPPDSAERRPSASGSARSPSRNHPQHMLAPASHPRIPSLSPQSPGRSIRDLQVRKTVEETRRRGIPVSVPPRLGNASATGGFTNAAEVFVTAFLRLQDRAAAGRAGGAKGIRTACCDTATGAGHVVYATSLYHVQQRPPVAVVAAAGAASPAQTEHVASPDGMQMQMQMHSEPPAATHPAASAGTSGYQGGAAAPYPTPAGSDGIMSKTNETPAFGSAAAGCHAPMVTPPEVPHVTPCDDGEGSVLTPTAEEPDALTPMASPAAVEGDAYFSGGASLSPAGGGGDGGAVPSRLGGAAALRFPPPKPGASVGTVPVGSIGTAASHSHPPPTLLGGSLAGASIDGTPHASAMGGAGVQPQASQQPQQQRWDSISHTHASFDPNPSPPHPTLASESPTGVGAGGVGAPPGGISITPFASVVTMNADGDDGKDDTHTTIPVAVATTPVPEAAMLPPRRTAQQHPPLSPAEEDHLLAQAIQAAAMTKKAGGGGAPPSVGAGGDAELTPAAATAVAAAVRNQRLVDITNSSRPARSEDKQSVGSRQSSPGKRSQQQQLHNIVSGSTLVAGGSLDRTDGGSPSPTHASANAENELPLVGTPPVVRLNFTPFGGGVGGDSAASTPPPLRTVRRQPPSRASAGPSGHNESRLGSSSTHVGPGGGPVSTDLLLDRSEASESTLLVDGREGGGPPSQGEVCSGLPSDAASGMSTPVEGLVSVGMFPPAANISHSTGGRGSTSLLQQHQLQQQQRASRPPGAPAPHAASSTATRRDSTTSRRRSGKSDHGAGGGTLAAARLPSASGSQQQQQQQQQQPTASASAATTTSTSSDMLYTSQRLPAHGIHDQHPPPQGPSAYGHTAPPSDGVAGRSTTATAAVSAVPASHHSHSSSSSDVLYDKVASMRRKQQQQQQQQQGTAAPGTPPTPEGDGGQGLSLPLPAPPQPSQTTAVASENPWAPDRSGSMPARGRSGSGSAPVSFRFAGAPMGSAAVSHPVRSVGDGERGASLASLAVASALSTVPTTTAAADNPPSQMGGGALASESSVTMHDMLSIPSAALVSPGASGGVATAASTSLGGGGGMKKAAEPRPLVPPLSDSLPPFPSMAATDSQFPSSYFRSMPPSTPERRPAAEEVSAVPALEGQLTPPPAVQDTLGPVPSPEEAMPPMPVLETTMPTVAELLPRIPSLKMDSLPQLPK